MNAFIYDEDIAKQLRQAFEKDIEQSKLLTKEVYDKRPLSIKFKRRTSKINISNFIFQNTLVKMNEGIF